MRSSRAFAAWLLAVLTLFGVAGEALPGLHGDGDHGGDHSSHHGAEASLHGSTADSAPVHERHDGARFEIPTRAPVHLPALCGHCLHSVVALPEAARLVVATRVAGRAAIHGAEPGTDAARLPRRSRAPPRA